MQSVPLGGPVAGFSIVIYLLMSRERSSTLMAGAIFLSPLLVVTFTQLKILLTVILPSTPHQ